MRIEIWQRLHIFTNEINAKNHLVHTMEKHISFQWGFQEQFLKSIEQSF